MSTTERKVKTKFEGDSSDLKRAAREAERELERVRRESEREQAAFVTQTSKGADKVTASLATMVRGVLAVGSAVSSAQGLAGVAATVGAMSGALLAVPGVLLAGAAAAGTFKLATAGFSDAVAADDLEAWTEATKNMAPEAVKTATAVRDQRDRFNELRKTVQGRFFAGFDSDVRSLAEKYFPLLKSGLGDIAGELNAAGRASGKALMAPSAVEDVNQVLKGSRDLLHELEPAAGNVLSAILDLGGVGAARAGGLGKAISGVTQDFREFVAEGVKSGKVNDLIDEGVDTAKDFGRVLTNVGQIGGKLWKQLNSGEEDFLDGIIKTTQAVEDFLDSAEGQEAIRALSETLKVTADVARNVLSTALREAAPIVRDLAPAVQEVARGVGEFLVNALETAGPLLHGVAQFLSENKEIVGELVPPLLGLAVAYKGLKVATEVKGWVAGIPSLFDDIGKKATAAGDAIGDPKSGKGMAGKLGGLKGAAAAAALGAVAIGMDEVNTAGGDGENLKGFADDLHNFAGAGKEIASLNFGGIFKEIGDEWQTMVDKFNKGDSPLGELFGNGKRLRMEVRIGANTVAAEFETKKLLNYVNNSAGTVNINGNDNPAGFALRQILDEISKGKETVTIDGQAVPAQDALAKVIDQINQGTGTVRLNGNDIPAGQALQNVLSRINGSQGVIGVSANTAAAQGVIDNFIMLNNGKTVQIYTSVLGSGGLASAGRLATGGPVRGPGTGTSDTAGLFALSNGEHVLTAEEVRAAGGHDAIMRLRRALTNGRITRLATGGPAVPSYLSRSLPAPRSSMPSVTVAPGAAPQVRVFIGEREITDVVRTEIDHAQRQADRRASTGPGGAW